MKQIITAFIFTFLLISFQDIYSIDTEFLSSDSIITQEIEEITVTGLSATKLNLPYDEITQEGIFNRGFHSVADAVISASGIDMARDGMWATTVLIRGLPDSKILFLSDGDRLQTATDLSGILSTIDMESLERIEVIKGAGSVLYGTGAMGGIVNFVTKRPEYTDKFTVGGQLSSGFHSVNKLWGNHANLRLTNQDWYVAFDGTYRRADNTKTPIGAIPNSHFNDASFNVLAGIKYDENQEFLVNYKHFQAWDVGLPGGNVFPETARVKYLGYQRNQLNGEYILKNISREVKQVNIKANTQNIIRDVENIVSEKMAVFPGSVNATSGLQATADLYFNDYETMTVGVEGWYRDQQTSRLRIESKTDTIVTREQPTPNAGMLDIGVFAQHKWIIDPKYWTINTGLRFDYIRTANDTAFQEIAKHKYVNGEKVKQSPDKTILFDAGLHNQFAYAAHIDVEYKPFERNKFTLSLANAYRVASLEERFKYIDQAGDLRVGSPDLKPEKGLFANLNYTYTGDKFIFKTDLFGNYLFDLIAEKQGVYTNPAGTSYANTWISTNIDRAYFVGGEMEFLWLIHRNLDFDTKISYVYAADVKTSKHLPRIPPLFLAHTLSYKIDKIALLYAEMDWDLEFRDVHTGNRKETVFTSIFNIGFETAPINIRPVDVIFAGGIHNIFNKETEDPMSTLRGINKLEPGRNLFVKAKIKL